jgi:hypothetical protein
MGRNLSGLCGVSTEAVSVKLTVCHSVSSPHLSGISTANASLTLVMMFHFKEMVRVM